jgi:hypothetical protein
MRNAKHVVAVMVVATALCADQVAAAQPSHRAGMGEAARQLASRISIKLQRVVPAVRIQFASRTAFSLPCEAPLLNANPLVSHDWPLSPFQFRLPPPSLI